MLPWTPLSSQRATRARREPLRAFRRSASTLPGAAHVDQRAVLALALPLMANSAVQIVLNLTDMWFMGRISTKALAAVGAVQWLIIVAVLVLGGAGTAVQTLVAQHYGGRRYMRAGQAVWTALWGMACAAPVFLLVGAARHLILTPFGFDAEIERLAAAFWFPRVGGAFVGAAVWATARLLQRHRPAARDLVDHARHDARQRTPEPGLHLRPRVGHRRLRLGDQRRAADRAVVRARHLSAALLPAGVPLAPDLAAACASACSSSCASAYRWGCRRRRTCSALRSSR